MYVVLHIDTSVDSQTGLLFTLNDRSQPSSTMVTLFGNPNDYAWRLANTTDLPIYWRYLTSSTYDSFHAVTIFSKTKRVFYGNNALGIIVHSLIYNNDTTHRYYFAPPISKRVNFNAVFVTR